jgi:phosphatidylinositol-bisphosphatase
MLCKQIVSQLPTHHRHVFHYIAAFLREVIRHSKDNGVDAKVLATLFGSIVLRDPPGTNLGHGIMARSSQQVLDMKKARFVYHFLINDPDDPAIIQ